MLTDQAVVPAMVGAWDELADRGRTGERVGHDHSWPAPAPQRLAQETLGRRYVASRLQKDVEHLVVRIDHAPECVLPAADRDDPLVKVPLVIRPSPIPSDQGGGLRPEASDQNPDRLSGPDHAALSRQPLNVAQAKPRARGEAYSVGDDLTVQAMALQQG